MNRGEYGDHVKIDFTEVLQAGRAYKPVGLTLVINWAVKPFTMYAVAAFFLGTLLLPLMLALVKFCEITRHRFPADR